MKLKFFDIAKKLSEKSEYHHKLGAVITKKNKIIGLGFNKPFKTHPKSNNNFKTIHAELDAILDCIKQDLEGSSIYIYRENKAGIPVSAKPCFHCQELIRRFKLKKVYYTEDGNYKEYVV